MAKKDPFSAKADHSMLGSVNKIALLSDEAINQIAAGEVVENPASVIKELVDNALDAGALVISIEIQAGGHQSIVIEDDGCGMPADDVRLCLLRHATSKIRSITDLDRLATMGFRGEALAAISSVSKMEIRTSDGKEATRLLAEAGAVLAIEPCARNRGTTLEVRSLFFNAPARRKFQKSPQASSAAIVRVVQALASSHPDVAFSLTSQGQTLLDVRPGGAKERIDQLWGDQGAVWFEEEEISGALGAPDFAKPTRTGQHFFLNRRPIASPLLSKALRDGYGTRIGAASHPSAVLFLHLDPEEYDVNVHPQKKEVRFRNEGKVFMRVKEAVQNAFLPRSEPLFPEFFSEPLPSLREEPLMPPSVPIESQGMLWPQERDERPLAVIGSFFLFECEGGIYLADLSSAGSQKIFDVQEKQSLIFPIQIDLARDEEEDAEGFLSHLHCAGLEARRVGSQQLCIDACPKWMETEKIEQVVDALKEDFRDRIPPEATMQRIMRKGFVKKYSLQEAVAFLRQNPSVKKKSLKLSDFEKWMSEP